jgi:peptide/nickel transport system substrate-binding protein
MKIRFFKHNIRPLFRLDTILLAGFMSFPGNQSIATAADGRLPVIATTLSAGSWAAVLHPLADATPRESWLRNLVHGRLVGLDRDWKWECQLCTSLPSAENGQIRKLKAQGKSGRGGKEGLVLDFEIPAIAKWGDGTPVTGNDFRLAWQIAMAMSPSSRAGNTARAIKEVTVDAKSTRRFSMELKEPAGDFWFAFSLRPVPAHIEGPVWENAAGVHADYLKNSTYVIDPGKPGLYSGPWMPRMPQPRASGAQAFVLLEANPGFAKGKARAQQITIRFYRDEKTALTDVAEGRADIVPETDTNPFLLRKMPSLPPLYSALGTEVEHLDFNLRNPLLTDINLRKAISLSINRHELARVAGMPQGLPMAYGVLHPAMTGLPVRTDTGELMNALKFSHKVLGYAPSEASALLQQSGWNRTITPEGNFWQKEGRVLEVEMDTSLVDSMRGEVMRSVTRQLQEAGMKVVVREHPPETFSRETLRKVRFKYLALYAWRMPAATVPDAILATRQIPTLQNNYSGENAAGWSNKEVDEMLDALRSEWGSAARQEILKNLEQKISADLPFIPLFRRPVVAAVAKRVQGFELGGHDGWSSSSAHTWKFTD